MTLAELEAIKYLLSYAPREKNGSLFFYHLEAKKIAEFAIDRDIWFKTHHLVTGEEITHADKSI